METPCSLASCKADQALLVKPELPPKKRTLDRGKAVCDEPEQRNNLQIDSNSFELPKNNTLGIAEQAEIIDPQDQQKACLDQNPPKVVPKTEIALKKEEPEPSLKIFLDLTEGSIGESSNPPPLPLPEIPPFSRRPIVCKYCGLTFSSTQALGGHQNAHRQERELQKAMKAANEFGRNPFLYSVPGTAPPLLHVPYMRNHRFQYHPYNTYAQSAFQARPVYNHSQIGLARGPTGLGRALGEFIGPTSAHPVGSFARAPAPGWAMPYAPSIDPIRRSNESTNYNSLEDSNMTAYLQAVEHQARLTKQYMERSGHNLSYLQRSNLAAFLQARENEASLTKKQSMEPSGLNLSLMCTESAKMDSPPECDAFSKLESTKLDLNLKL